MPCSATVGSLVEQCLHFRKSEWSSLAQFRLLIVAPFCMALCLQGSPDPQHQLLWGWGFTVLLEERESKEDLLP